MSFPALFAMDGWRVHNPLPHVTPQIC